MRRVYPSLTHTVGLSLMLALLVSIAMAQAKVQGQWGTLPSVMPINSVYAALLSNGAPGKDSRERSEELPAL